MYWPRILIGFVIILGAFAGHVIGTWAVIEVVRSNWAGSTEALALICKMIGDATGALTALATMVVSWFYGSTVGSARKTDVIQQIAGKG